MAVEVIRSSSVTGSGAPEPSLTSGVRELLVSAVRLPLDSVLSPEQAVLSLRGDSRPFALVGDWFSGVCVLGSEPVCVAGPDEDPFSVLERMPQLATDLTGDVTRTTGGLPSGASGSPMPLVGGGWVGWLGYRLGALIERLPPPPPAPVPMPPFSLAFYDHAVVFDGERWWFEALWSEARSAVLRARLAVWEGRLAGRPAPPDEAAIAAAMTSPFTLAGCGAAGHVTAVAECRQRIAAGELFQANLCLRLESRLSGSALDLFARALPLAGPRFGAFVDGAFSLSPERFLRRSGRSVWTEPIKGTRPRASGPGDQQAAREAREELVSSTKDSAEHVMIVDLMRNDLGRVCEYGSVRAEPARAEAHSGVWHLVSTVSGTLRHDVGDRDLLRAAFPPGSVTGAPKVQAMKVISELEATRRELYTGAIGIVSPLAGLDMSVAIRTFEVSGDSIWFGAGGGIVADSDPELELAEALTKARGPVAAIGGTVAEPTALTRPRSSSRVPRALAYGARPDPVRGVFETILVEERRPVLLEAHLARLAASLESLYGVALDLGLAGVRVSDAASRLGAVPARLRVLADPDGSLSVTVSDAGGVAGIGGYSPGRVSLTPFSLPGGLGAHKWRDRELLDSLSALQPGAVPLLIDTDGVVLEAAHANVWITEGDALITPPADGRLLPGVTRAALLSSDQYAREESLDLVRMEQADSIFLTSSISGRRAASLTARRVDDER